MIFLCAPSRQELLEHVERVTIYPNRIELSLGPDDDPVVIPTSLIRFSGE